MVSNKISQAEFSVMQVLWSKNQATSQEIINILSEEKNLQASTIQGMLSRLVRKGVVGIRKKGRYNIYFPTISEEERMRQNIALSEHICARKIGKHISEMIQNHTLSFEDLALIQQSINDKEQFAVEEVMCNCPPGVCSGRNCNCKKEDRQFSQTPSNIIITKQNNQ